MGAIVIEQQESPLAVIESTNRIHLPCGVRLDVSYSSRLRQVDLEDINVVSWINAT